MPWPAPATLVLEERGDGVGVLTSALERMGEYHAAGSKMVDGGFLGKSLQLLKGGKKYGGKNWQISRW